MRHLTIAAALAAAALLSLSACGGGGGSSAPVIQPPEPPVQEPDPDPEPPALEPEPPIAAPVTMTLHEGFEHEEDFGLWAKVGNETLFEVYILLPDGTGAFYQTLHAVSPSRSAPVSGSAVWTGQAIGYLMTFRRGVDQPYIGSARLEADFSATTLDADITFPHLASQFQWRDVKMWADGDFETYPNTGGPSISGSFFGAEHQGAAGHFTHPDVVGVFGALRE